jgi:DNA-binding transcriptional LysR family regulator
MELHWVEAFIAVAEELHFGRAAERLRMAQSPLSQTIRKLERAVGTPLFDRNTRRVTLTPAGMSFLPHARRIVDELDLAQRAATAATGDLYGSVTIAYSGALNHRTLPPLTRALRARHPHVELRLVAGMLTREAVKRLEEGRVDFAFAGLPLHAPGLDVRPVAVDRLGAVLPLDHPLTTRDAIDLAELADDPWVMLPARPGSSIRDATTAACLQAGFSPDIVQEISEPYTALSLVAGGVGVSLMPECVADILPAGTVFVPLAGPLPLPVSRSAVVWNPAQMTPALQAVVDTCAEVLPLP